MFIDHHRLAIYSRYMANDENFEKLALELPLKERQSLLEKLRSESVMATGPLHFDDEKSAPAYEIQTEFAKLPFLQRIWYFILSFFQSRSPVKVFEEKRVAVLGNMVDERSAGLYNYQKAMLLPGFFRQIQRLKTAAKFFYSALDSSVNRDKGAFFAFLGSLEMPKVHSVLEERTTPEFISALSPGKQEVEMRQIAHRTMDEGFGMITEENRNAMYFNARTLNCLKELSSFLYDRVLMAFTVNNAVGGEVCSAGVVRDLLITLNNILFSLKIIPPLTLLQSLFIFILQERASAPNFDIDRETSGLLAKAEESLTVIRDFNKKVPLLWILRCATRNMALASKEISGGEDWFVIYRDYLKRRIDSQFNDFTKVRVQEELIESFRSFLKGKSLVRLENAQSESNSDGIPLYGAFALAFLNTFYSVVFIPDIYWVLKTLLIDSDWRKKEARIEYAESYNILIKLSDEIAKIERNISPEGEYGQRYAQARQEMSSLQVKRRKVQIVVEEASEDAEKVLEQARTACGILVNIVGGILANDTKGRADIISNLAKIGGDNVKFMNGMRDAIDKLNTVLRILNDIDIMESERQ